MIPKWASCEERALMLLILVGGGISVAGMLVVIAYAFVMAARLSW